MTSATVLLIDDEPASVALPDGVTTIRSAPQDDGFGSKLVDDLGRADLILIDQNLDLPESLGLAAIDGASFVGHLRSWARVRDLALPPLVIFTSEVEAFKDEIPTLGPAVPLDGGFSGREAAIAPALDVEWLVSKEDPASSTLIRGLARDGLLLKTMAKDGKMDLEAIGAFMRLPCDRPWSEMALEQLAKWRPPVNGATETSAGRRGATPVLRWLLQRVMACPGLLLSDLQAAWSLGIEPGGLGKLTTPSNGRAWASAFRATLYDGAAHDLAGRRWWAAGVDYLGWQLRQKADTTRDFQTALDELAGGGIAPLSGPDKVVVVDVDLAERGLASLADAVQIHPPGWALESPDPWMRRDEVDADPVARSMVDPTEMAVSA